VDWLPASMILFPALSIIGRIHDRLQIRVVQIMRERECSVVTYDMVSMWIKSAFSFFDWTESRLGSVDLKNRLRLCTTVLYP